ncbi:MAG: hypothetical protein C4554_03270 [Dethiobacter sp.]|jgi:stage III sporulation protein AF|nr:MAG: hypothetical protein C4554_03270 [Dethiobacter sp.]
MIEATGNLIRYIVILLFLSTLLEMILPQGVFRRYLRMIVGILLIFTLLTPLQKIMRMAPYWEMPALSGGVQNDKELSAILQQGGEMYRENINIALEDYRYKIFSLLENEFDRKFGQKLLHLEVSMEENPESREFGSLKGIYAVVREKGTVDTGKSGGKVEEVRITVNLTGKNGSTSRGGVLEEKEFMPDDIYLDKALDMHRYIAAYFQLPSEKVEVKILP